MKVWKRIRTSRPVPAGADGYSQLFNCVVYSEGIHPLVTTWREVKISTGSLLVIVYLEAKENTVEEKYRKHWKTFIYQRYPFTNVSFFTQ